MKTVIRGNLLLFLQYTTASLVPLLLLPVIVRAIGLPTYGKLSLALAYAGYCGVIIQFAFNLTGPRRLADATDLQSQRNIFQNIVIAKAVLLFGILAVSIIILILFGRHYIFLDQNVIFIITAISLGSFFNSAWYLNYQGKFATYTLFSILITSGIIFFGFKISNIDHGVTLFAAALLSIGPFMIGAVTFLLALSNTRYGKRKNIQIKDALSIIKSDSSIFLSQFVGFLYAGVGTVIVGIVLGVDDAGAFSVIERVTNSLIAGALLSHTAAYPTLLRLYDADRRKYWKLLRFVIASYLAFTLITSALAVLFLNEICLYLYGDEARRYETLVLSALAWMNLAVFGTAVTGYMTTSRRTKEILPLTLKIMGASFAVGGPALLLFGPAGWLLGLIASQVVLIQNVVKYRNAEFKRERSLDVR